MTSQLAEIKSSAVPVLSEHAFLVLDIDQIDTSFVYSGGSKGGSEGSMETFWRNLSWLAIIR